MSEAYDESTGTILDEANDAIDIAVLQSRFSYQVLKISSA